MRSKKLKTVITLKFISLIIILLIPKCQERKWNNPIDSNSILSVATLPALFITSNEAVLGGEVICEDSSAIIERGICYSTSKNPTVSSNKVEMGRGTGTFSKTVAGLKSNATYYVRAYIIYGQDEFYGNHITFTTLELQKLMAITNPAGEITRISATLNGIVNANNSTTIVTFEYGETTNYGNTIVAVQSPIAGNTNTIVSADVFGLSVNTTYHFRVTAINGMEEAFGSDYTFQTLELLAPDSTVAYYPFNGNTNDESGNNRHGVFNNITFEYDRNDQSNSAAYFYGNGSVRVLGLGQTHSFSISVWYKTTGSGIIIATDNIYLYTDKTYDCFGTVWNNTGGTYTPGGNPVYLDDTWHHVVVTHDGVDERIVTYFDNKVGHNRPDSDQFIGNYEDIYIGFGLYDWFGAYISNFTGAIDDVYFYKRALSADEVQQLYLSKD